MAEAPTIPTPPVGRVSLDDKALYLTPDEAGDATNQRKARAFAGAHGLVVHTEGFTSKPKPPVPAG